MPGQFFMLEAPGRLLPRPMSLCLAPRGRARVPDRPDRARERGRSARSSRATSCTCSARSATASASTSSGRCSSAAGSGSRRCRTSPTQLGRRRRCSASARDWHAEAAALVPNAEVVHRADVRHRADPDGPVDVLACGPEPMLARGPRARAGRPARLGGADGVRLRRLLRLRGRDRRRAGSASASKGRCSVLLNASGCLDALTAPETARAARRLRDEDVTPLPRGGNAPVADRRDRRRDAELDRARQPGPRALPRRDAAAAARARRAALGLGRRVRGARVRRDLRRARRT